MTTRGRFIVLEGGEGSGKSTQAALLAEHLGADLTREPGGTALGERLRELLLATEIGEITPRAELLLMAAARAQHVRERIAPALGSGRDVVCDRFVGSTLAYQGYGRGLPLEDVLVANELATDGLRPDLTVLLDLPVEVAAARLSGVTDRIEGAGVEFHRQVFAGFRSLAAADSAGWIVIDATPPAHEVAARVLEAVQSELGRRDEWREHGS
jgi:dTMP kinase